jgi:hypothetical protein
LFLAADGKKYVPAGTISLATTNSNGTRTTILALLFN